MKSGLVLRAFLFLSLLTPAAGAAAQAGAGERPAVEAVRLNDSEQIEVDGFLDEEVWDRAVPAANFIQQDPDNGAPATEQTEVRFLYTTEALYMGVTAYDSEPEKWLGYQRRRDEFLQSDDRFMWTIDTFNNQQTGYFFEMNPSGLMGDALRGANFNERRWDGIWTGIARRSEIGWTLEIEIPFSTLNFDPTAEAWGINFQRTVRRKNEESLWTGWLRNQGLNRLSNAGLLTGLEGISGGRGLDIKPYVIGTSESFPGRGDNEVHNDADVGVDLFFSPTPSVRTNLTVNTDFAQAEVDTRLTNLERFPQFFPEKRDFFLDGSSFFDFQSAANNDNSLLPFFTRRIGLNQGVPQGIDVGGKLAGQMGRSDVGALYVRTREEDSIIGEDFMVLRGKRRMLRQSYVGAMYTGRNPRDVGGDMRHTLGVDFVLATSTFLGSENLSLGGFFLNTSDPLDVGHNNAWGLALNFPNDPWSGGFGYREIEENYNAAVGFTPRTGFRRFRPEISYTTRPNQHAWIRTIQYGLTSNLIYSTVNNEQLNREFDFTVFNLGTHRQDAFQFHILPTYERLERDFTINPGVTLPVGNDYSWNRYRFQVTTAPRRIVALD
ncbi:MAG: carbohydrate binding family 9 domain-containing protein, partial [Vicinamibacterales bacterium]